MAVSLRDVVSFGRYEPLFRIASGGMAEVFAARIRGEAGFQKLVAVKRMHPHLAADPGFVDMFLNEARVAAHVDSPHAVQTLDLGRGSDGSLYIVMELVLGLSLATLQEQRRGPLPPAVAAEVIAQAAQGLDDAHEATTPAGDPLGLIHRDVSPHNLLLGLDGRVRVTDFGIAHAVHRPRAGTSLRELKGKFAYMSPEQTRLRPLDRRSDVFSLGVVAWELLVGRRLFAAHDPAETIRNVRRAPVPAPHERVPAVPEAIGAVVARALERDPDRRFATAAALGAALRDAARAALDAPADPKRVAGFVREAGGEALERLRRLIRLGTEGADPDALEALQPGATRVLPGDASEVLPRAGTGRGTERLEGDPPPVPTVTLTADDEPEVTASTGVPGGAVGTDVLLASLDRAEERPRRDASPARRRREAPRATGSRAAAPGADPGWSAAELSETRDWKAVRAEADPREPIAPPRDAREASATATSSGADADADSTHEWKPADGPDGPSDPDDPDARTRPWRAQSGGVPVPKTPLAARARARRSSSWRGAAAGALIGLVLVAAVVLAILLWPRAEPRVPLPLEPREPPAADPRP